MAVAAGGRPGGLSLGESAVRSTPRALWSAARSCCRRCRHRGARLAMLLPQLIAVPLLVLVVAPWSPRSRLPLSPRRSPAARGRGPGRDGVWWRRRRTARRMADLDEAGLCSRSRATSRAGLQREIEEVRVELEEAVRRRTAAEGRAAAAEAAADTLPAMPGHVLAGLHERARAAHGGGAADPGVAGPRGLQSISYATRTPRGRPPWTTTTRTSTRSTSTASSSSSTTSIAATPGRSWTSSVLCTCCSACVGSWCWRRIPSASRAPSRCTSRANACPRVAGDGHPDPVLAGALDAQGARWMLRSAARPGDARRNPRPRWRTRRPGPRPAPAPAPARRQEDRPHAGARPAPAPEPGGAAASTSWPRWPVSRPARSGGPRTPGRWSAAPGPGTGGEALGTEPPPLPADPHRRLPGVGADSARRAGATWPGTLGEWLAQPSVAGLLGGPPCPRGAGAGGSWDPCSPRSSPWAAAGRPLDAS